MMMARSAIGVNLMEWGGQVHHFFACNATQSSVELTVVMKIQLSLVGSFGPLIT